MGDQFGKVKEDIAVTRPSDEYVDSLGLFPKKKELPGETSYSSTVNALLKDIGPQQDDTFTQLDEKKDSVTAEENIALLLAKKLYYLHQQQIQTRKSVKDSLSLAETRITFVARSFLTKLEEKLNALEERVKSSENLLQQDFAAKEELKELEETLNSQKGVSLPEVEELIYAKMYSLREEIEQVTQRNESIQKHFEEKFHQDQLFLDKLLKESFREIIEQSKSCVEHTANEQRKQVLSLQAQLTEIKLESTSEKYAPLDKFEQSLHEIEELREEVDSLGTQLFDYSHEITSSIVCIDDDIFKNDDGRSKIHDDLLEVNRGLSEIRDRLGEISSQQSELWQLARRTSREVSEAKASVWESREAIKLKQVQEEQATCIASQYALIAEMRKRLDTLEDENKSLRQKTKTEEIAKPLQNPKLNVPKPKKQNESKNKEPLALVIVAAVVANLIWTSIAMKMPFMEFLDSFPYLLENHNRALWMYLREGAAVWFIPLLVAAPISKISKKTFAHCYVVWQLVFIALTLLVVFLRV